MVSAERAAIIIFGLALFVTSGSALRCWVCSSNVNVMCNDPMNTTDHQAAFHIRTCDPGPYGSSKPICRKIVKREYGERIIIRQCSTPYHDEIDVVNGQCGNSMSQPGRDVIESCHICSTDLCNSATDASATRLLYVATLILLACTFHQSKYVL
ncbi:PREDICTED: uncharacterized protein LOC105564300 [Vollenhovia emeryi]|uniref:uncharacterized protein LOC105564300 n=1 Tax=Vollenhovia emeryi TaxID=411798 RepID=UPI0005F3CB5D|nr:PREDICTED: uncharacterized protein LOC105564300 [Vollenhovia emeryi]